MSEPLAKPDPRLVQELFDKDPLELTTQDLDTIIHAFRAERMEYLQPPEEKPKKAKAVKEVKGPEIPIDPDLLDILGLEPKA